METTPPFHVVTGQRQLAVIMFTDAVNFSARMHEQEVATLNRMERDLAIIRRTAEAQAGTVLKSTGDGLLIIFSSAVQAVNCALEIQQGFAAGPQAGGETTGLRHRVGIHLGDVFVSGGDAMGDGVNIAARLVAEAPPGGIIVSQMVHDVVKNKVPLHAVRLGPRHLKNIKEPVPLFRLLLEPPNLPGAAPPPAPVSGPERPGPEPVAPAPAVPASRPSRVLLAVGVVALLAVAAWWLVQAQFAHERELSRSQSDQAALAELLRQAPVPVVPAGPAAGGFDFAAATTRVPARARAAPEPDEMLRAADRLSSALLAWLPEALQAYHRDRPLRVRDLGDPAFAGATVFADEQGRIQFVEGGATRARAWQDLGDPVLSALIVTIVQAAPAGAPVDLPQSAEAFAYLRGRPEMIAALRR